MALKEIYYSFEEKWYAALDKVEKYIPVYKIIDPIDSVIPSFLLFILFLVVLIALGVFFVLSMNQVFDATFTVITNDNKPVNDSIIKATLMQNGTKVRDVEQRTDAAGQIIITGIGYGQEIVFDIALNKGTYAGAFTVTQNIEERIKLNAPPIVLEPVTKKVFVKTQTGQQVDGTLNLTFGCEGSTVLPQPSSAAFSGSPIEVVEPVNCRLTATVNNPKYKQKTYFVDSVLYDLFLEVYEPPAVKLKVKVRADNYPVNDTSFKIKVSGDNTYETSTFSASEATLSVLPGNYVVAVSDAKNNYGAVTQTVKVEKETEIVLSVSKSIKSIVTIKIIDTQTKGAISGAIVNVKDSIGRELFSQNTNSEGKVFFSFTDLGDYIFAAKKLGDINGGYFSKELKQTLTGDLNATLELEKITTSNAGRVKVKVKDQDGIAVINAKVMLKYVENDGIVELLQQNNYGMTDLNGEVIFVAGKIEGMVYAYAIKSPFFGSSTQSKIEVDRENLFTIQMEVGIATIKINLKDELDEKISGTAEILTVDGTTVDPHGLAGLISVENGTATRQVKAGQTVFVKVKADTFETYYSAPVMLWPNRTYTFDMKMKSQFLEPKITLQGIYNESDAVVRTMAAGKKYYAKLLIESDDDYAKVLMHFRAGKETLLENDAIQIDNVEAAEKSVETRGVSYSPEKGYAFDSENLTDGLAKWVNVEWKNFGRAMREVKVHFSIKKQTPANKELVFFYRAQFDSTKKPASTASEAFYSDTYTSDIYYVGEEATCADAFCVTNEWLYSKKEDLYIYQPYSIKQVSEYGYHFVLINNSEIDYGETKKPIYLNMRVLGNDDGEALMKINSYTIKDSVSTVKNPTAVLSAQNITIKNFEKNASIDFNLNLEGLKDGAEAILFELKSEGVVIFSKETTFSVVKEKDFLVQITPQFIPAMINTKIQVKVFDEKENYLPGASVISYAKEPGFEEYVVSRAETDRMGLAVVDSGALFNKSQVYVEIAKEGYSRQKYGITVSEDVIIAAPEQLVVQLNTYTKREEIKEVSFGNRSAQKYVLKDVIVDAKFSDLINEDALYGYIGELADEQRTLESEGVLEVDLLKIRLANDVEGEAFLEPVNITGSVKIIFEQPELRLLYDVEMPMTLSVSSSSNPGTDCLVINPTSKTTMTTEKAQVRFDFEMLNACASDDVAIPVENLSVISSQEIPGIAELSIRNSSGTSIGRTALDGSKRKILDTVRAGEKLFGTITFAPSEDAIGKTITLSVSYEAKFQNQIIKSSPATVNYKVNVINLKECMSIKATTGIVAFDGTAKVTVDSSACLGQMIDVILCNNDSGCSGGTEGKVVLSTKSFSIQNKSQEIDVYGPSIPGTYGVSVNARARGTPSFTYIGEVPVTFREMSTKAFKLNKYELLLQGEGAEDAILLNNSYVAQNVRVKADGCVWGAKDPGTDWMQVMSGAMLGAMLGNMVGAGFKTQHPSEAESKSKTGSGTTNDSGAVEDELTSEMSLEERAEYSTTKNNAEEALKNIDKAANGESVPGGNVLVETYTNAEGSKITKYDTTYKTGDGGTETITAYYVNGDPYKMAVVGDYGRTDYYNISGSSPTSYATDIAMSSYANESTLSQITNMASYPIGWATESVTYDATDPLGIPSGYKQTDATLYMNGEVIHSNDPQDLSTLVTTGPAAAPAPATVGYADMVSSAPAGTTLSGTYVGDQTWAAGTDAAIAVWNPTTNVYDLYGDSTTNMAYVDSVESMSGEGLTIKSSPLPTIEKVVQKLLFSALSFPGEAPKVVDERPKASFTIYQGHESGWFTLIGATIGGVLAYMTQDFDCSDQEYDQIVGYVDFVILLQGTTVNVADPQGNGNEEKQVPSDAGELGFSLSEISPEWDFSDASISSTETVAIRFTNNGLDDPQARYGVLTVNSTKHTHGYDPTITAMQTSTGTTTSSTSYDVLCTEATFGNYWIGSKEGEGKCSGVSQSNYSQKYHLRIISADPKGNEAYVKKYSSCYMGALTGSTGAEALPRMKLNWDWDAIQSNSCDYGNPNYIYCDGAQFMIALTKKLAELDEFLMANGSSFDCPPDKAVEDVTYTIQQMNSQTTQVLEGTIGVSNIAINLNNNSDETTAQVELNNKTGASQETYISYSWKGQGEPITGTEPITVPAGKSTMTFGPASTPAYDGIYYFTAIVNGEKGDRTPVTRAFLNMDPTSDCWVEQTTDQVAGVPGLVYYVDDLENVTYTNTITDPASMYSKISFGAYLTRDAFTEDFFKDFKEFYKTQFLQKVTVNQTELAIVEYLDSGKFSIKKKYSGENSFEPGLYDVYINLTAPEDFRVIDENNTTIDVELLLVKTPSTDYPFYRMPFDGMMGQNGGRQGYGTYYINEDDAEIKVNDLASSSFSVSTFNSGSSNGVTSLTTKTKTSFDSTNASIGTRAQMAIASVSGTTAELALTPIYATPIIGKMSMDTQSGNMAFAMENAKKAVSTGGNLGYWTGAAKSKDFYGTNAIDVYNDSPDYRLSKLGDNVYGFEFNDASRQGSMYLKSLFFVPADASAYMLTSKDTKSTALWTPNSEFAPSVQMNGITGMKYNDLQANSYVKSLEDLFNAVLEGKVCVSNDGSTTSFWWNPYVIENTKGSITSMSEKETQLIGKN